MFVFKAASTSTLRRARWVLLLATFFVAGLALAADLDEGKLQSSWFGKGELSFVAADEVDYLWVLEGYSFEGKTLHFKPWSEPEFLGPDAKDRDEKDRRLARQMNVDMPNLFVDTWGEKLRSVKVSLDKGDLVVDGRIVDCSTGSTAAKVLVGFGAGSGYVVIDLRVREVASGKLVMAVHHRVVSGTSWSTTDSKFVKWVGKFARDAEKAGGFAKLYAKGDPVKK